MTPSRSRKRKEKESSTLLDLRPDQVEEIREAFRLFDTDDSGYIASKELKAALRALGIEPKRDELQQLTREVDPDSTHIVEFDRFLELAARKLSERDINSEIIKIFRLFDDDNTGRISFRNLKRVAREVGEPITDEELREMLEEADRDGDGEVSEEEFVRIMKKTGLF
ncbi:uncharacterized protein VTP21DRAFT_11477 [Calcarisporiella thermophila]|uniref:uncharacterized protein n=1 Tax=Calcarisporiella thermophila TaxID=911321 RepID=UPI003742E8DD